MILLWESALSQREHSSALQHHAALTWLIAVFSKTEQYMHVPEDDKKSFWRLLTDLSENLQRNITLTVSLTIEVGISANCSGLLLATFYLILSRSNLKYNIILG